MAAAVKINQLTIQGGVGYMFARWPAMARRQRGTLNGIAWYTACKTSKCHSYSFA